MCQARAAALERAKGKVKGKGAPVNPGKWRTYKGKAYQEYQRELQEYQEWETHHALPVYHEAQRLQQRYLEAFAKVEAVAWALA